MCETRKWVFGTISKTSFLFLQYIFLGVVCINFPINFVMLITNKLDKSTVFTDGEKENVNFVIGLIN